LDCCEALRSGFLPRLCLPIDVPTDDPHFAAKQGCHDFKRSQTRRTCDSSSFEQINSITSFVDASFVYGSTASENEHLRSHQGGKLRMNFENRRLSHYGTLPKDLQPASARCSGEEAPDKLFVAGDERVNENPNLQMMHTLFAREHNRLADRIKAENGGDQKDEEIFQKARR